MFIQTVGMERYYINVRFCDYPLNRGWENIRNFKNTLLAFFKQSIKTGAGTVYLGSLWSVMNPETPNI